MDTFDREQHWDTIYNNKSMQEVSWYQPIPKPSLYLIKSFKLPLDAKIIDIGGGDSFLVDNLIELGFNDITVLDISAKAIEKAQLRLGDKAKTIKWIVSDAADFKPTEVYDLWHDRAAFHFLTDANEIDNYIATVNANINPEGYLVIATFSEQGPKKCSGIDIKQYSKERMQSRFNDGFELINSFIHDHTTPFNTVQNFLYCSFKRK